MTMRIQKRLLLQLAATALLVSSRSSFVVLAADVATASASQSQCSITDENRRDPALQEMEYDVGDGPKTTLVYVEPDVNTFYNLQDEGLADNAVVPKRTKVTPKFNGFQGKFINMSNKPMTLYWEERAGGAQHVMRNHHPFSASGTATFPGHRFFFAPVDHPEQEAARFVVGTYPQNLYVYDPYTVPDDPAATEQNLKVLNQQERAKYENWIKTLRFNEFYVNKTGRSYLANYLRDPPKHWIWPADYFGQEHWVTSRETHFVQHPPKAIANAPLKEIGRKRILKESQDRLLKEYRDTTTTDGVLNMTLKVISCAPRALEIKNFLSPTEVEHIIELAQGYELKLSSTGDISVHDNGVDKVAEDNRRTRTSKNTWVTRERSPIVDAIYRRAADVQRMDESLMRHRDKGERPDVKGIKPLTEQLQLVHYNVGEEYTGHHDFGFSRIDDENQGARFATLLLYLNSGVQGGATSFPRWANAETFHELRVEPEAGKAVLFYSQLPDGNLDDLSHHAAMPVLEGEKWLINLWTWSPIYD